VWAVDAATVFAVGDAGAIVRRSGGVWTEMTSGTSFNLRGVWAASASNAWAVGSGGTILRFDGTSWAPVGGVTSDLEAVWGSSATDVWLAGSGTVWHWTGSGAPVVSASFSGHLLSISGTGPTDVWTTGELTMVHHFTGTWQPTINPGASTSTFFAVLALAPGNAWVSDATTTRETMHLASGRWAGQSAPGSGFRGVAAFAANDLWGVGDSHVGHWDGSKWTSTTPFGTSVGLWSVATTPGNIWVVGDGALIAHQAL
jgi:hypothetical protein